MLGYLLLSLSGLLLLLSLQGRSFSCLVLGLHLTLKAFCPNFVLLTPWDGIVWWGLFTSDGEAFPGVLLEEVPSHMFFPRAPRKACGVIPSRYDAIG